MQKKKDKIKDKDDEDTDKDEITEIKKKELVPHAMQDIDYWKRKYVIFYIQLIFENFQYCKITFILNHPKLYFIYKINNI